MRIPGLAATRFAADRRPLQRKTSLALLASALLLSACVDPFTGQTTGEPSFLDQQPAIVTDETIYAARSDGNFTIPALPVEKIPESHRRQVVAYESDQPPGTIIIDPRYKLLYYVLGDGQAIRYGISVGAEGFQWSGESIVANKRHWPTWTPPKEMIERKPELQKWEKGQPGGPSNPLGSRAIYLTTDGRDYGYRIHGTPEWRSIGRNASSGCFRMINQDVMDLYERVKGGEKVIVLTASGEMPKGLNIPKPPAPKKKKVEAEAEVAPAIAGPVLPGAEPAADSPPTAPVGSNPVGSSPVVTSPLPDSSAPAAAAPAGTAPAAPAPSVILPATPAPGATAPAAVAPAAAAPAVSPAPLLPPAPAPAAAAPAAPSATTPLLPEDN